VIKPNASRSAFPTLETHFDYNGVPTHNYTPLDGEGLTKREWVAGQALSALVAHHGGFNVEGIVELALLLADELLGRLASQLTAAPPPPPPPPDDLEPVPFE